MATFRAGTTAFSLRFASRESCFPQLGWKRLIFIISRNSQSSINRFTARYSLSLFTVDRLLLRGSSPSKAGQAEQRIDRPHAIMSGKGPSVRSGSVLRGSRRRRPGAENMDVLSPGKTGCSAAIPGRRAAGVLRRSEPRPETAARRARSGRAGTLASLAGMEAHQGSQISSTMSAHAFRWSRSQWV